MASRTEVHVPKGTDVIRPVPLWQRAAAIVGGGALAYGGFALIPDPDMSGWGSAAMILIGGGLAAAGIFQKTEKV